MEREELVCGRVTLKTAADIRFLSSSSIRVDQMFQLLIRVTEAISVCLCRLPSCLLTCLPLFPRANYIANNCNGKNNWLYISVLQKQYSVSDIHRYVHLVKAHANCQLQVVAVLNV